MQSGQLGFDKLLLICRHVDKHRFNSLIAKSKLITSKLSVYGRRVIRTIYAREQQ